MGREPLWYPGCERCASAKMIKYTRSVALRMATAWHVWLTWLLVQHQSQVTVVTRTQHVAVGQLSRRLQGSPPMVQLNLGQIT